MLDDLAGSEGFCTLGITGPASIPAAGGRLDQALAEGHHATMDWLRETADRRRSPTALWDEVRSVAMLGFNYGPDRDPMATLEHRDRGTISVYARNRDYHDVIRAP